MTLPDGPLGELVRRLDALGPTPTLAQVHAILSGTRVSMDAARPWVRIDPRRYHRGRVVLRDAYELLVMTWLPGQSSVAHDHGGSICGMQVVDGTATERSYCVEADGSVRSVMQVHVPYGRTISGADSGIHSVHNLDRHGTLVTVHVYSPPLRDFRRFAVHEERPTSLRNESETVPAVPSVCIIGGGFSGCVTAAHVLRRAAESGQRVAVHVVERRGTAGEGAAYGTQDPSHLLNVRASNMSAIASEPEHFVHWLKARGSALGPTDFAPRMEYGHYVRDTLDDAARAARGVATLSMCLDEARRVMRRPDGGWLVHCARGPSITADAVVLASGHRPPGDPLHGRWHGSRTRWIADPWKPHAVTDIQPDEPVAIIGSGLTAVDVLLSLAGSNAPPRSAPIWVISRRAWLPQPHAAIGPKPAALDAHVAALLRTPRLTARALVAWFRGLIDDAQAAKADWRTIVDGLRPHTATIWRAMPDAERARAVRHIRPMWEVHRHRMASPVAEQVRAAVERGHIRMVSGRPERADAIDDAVDLLVRTPSRGSGAEQVLRVAWVVNCTGPVAAHAGDADPAIASLLMSGDLRADSLGLGIETDSHGRARAADGRIVDDLLLVGTLRKPDCWESTAVPELRVQAAEVAGLALACATGMKR
jgi:uncharacterized NAD(P)/FAD-binding protein YdhS/predicted metal-dependent enzyme (double-stranded beta helix superfamily)